ncbi:MAG TPA: precorrin-6y C5,15-methyltransferase (decarboxylating) subunit CbiE [Clostridia bacterium]|nr:precorrin-6y C5,15-methyltransferase (decarboxylating) subunit CbiE [Clostridia bacterium]
MNRLVGMGPGSLRYVTMEAVDRIKSADRVIAFGRIAKTAAEIRADIHIADKVEKVADMLAEEADNVILASGDPCFYGILDFLSNKGIRIDEVVPGISSMQYMMAKLKKSWQDSVLASFHGREADLMGVRNGRTAVILADSSHSPGYISGLLSTNGIKGRIYAGFNLSYEDELIVEKEIGEDIESVSNLALVVIENEMDQG